MSDVLVWQISTCFFGVLCGCFFALDAWRHRWFCEAHNRADRRLQIINTLQAALQNDAAKIAKLKAEIAALKSQVPA